MTNTLKNNFSNTLIKWYKSNGRDLPWRHTTDAYTIWVSEIILQQTRVEQGVDYFSDDQYYAIVDYSTGKEFNANNVIDVNHLKK